MRRPTSTLSLVILFSTIGYLFHQEHERFFAFADELSEIIALFMLVAVLLGLGVSRIAALDRVQTKTILIEVGIQNGMQAIFIATSPILFNNSVLAIPAVLYSVLMYIFVLLLYLVLKLFKRRVEVG